MSSLLCFIEIYKFVSNALPSILHCPYFDPNCRCQCEVQHRNGEYEVQHHNGEYEVQHQNSEYEVQHHNGELERIDACSHEPSLAMSSVY